MISFRSTEDLNKLSPEDPAYAKVVHAGGIPGPDQVRAWVQD